MFRQLSEKRGGTEGKHPRSAPSFVPTNNLHIFFAALKAARVSGGRRKKEKEGIPALRCANSAMGDGLIRKASHVSPSLGGKKGKGGKITFHKFATREKKPSSRSG